MERRLGEFWYLKPENPVNLLFAYRDWIFKRGIFEARPNRYIDKLYNGDVIFDKQEKNFENLSQYSREIIL